MKNLIQKGLVLSAIGIFLSSCSSTSLMTLSVKEPPPVIIPKEIQRVGIIDRSGSSEENQAADEIDKILSAEGKLLDKEGSGKAILGLYDELDSNKSLKDIVIIENENLRSPGMGIFLATLNWKTVQELCDKYQVDVLYVLSYYDTDAKATYKATPGSQETPIGIDVPLIEHQVTISTIVQTGWRMYDPAIKVIHDEFTINKQLTSQGKGLNPIKALKAVIGRKEAVLEASNVIGHRIGRRIVPYWRRVSRDYFVRGTDNFKVAQRRAQAGDWDGAAELWNQETENADAKIAGRAYYNMAIINEINGDLETAVDWASKSYADYNTKIGLRYSKILRNRIRKRELLK